MTRQEWALSSSPEGEGFKASPHLMRLLSKELKTSIGFLAVNQRPIVEKWTDLYLSTFGRRSYFSASRVRQLFEQMTAAIMECLRDRNLDTYLGEIGKTGKLFNQLGVPFEEVLLCVHLFQESCLRVAREHLDFKPNGRNELKFAFDELGRLGSSAFALSYFRSVKEDWEQSSRASQAEGEQIRKELEDARRELFSTTRHRLTAMELAMSAIDHKLKSSVTQYGHIQRLTAALAELDDASAVVKCAYHFYARQSGGSHEIWIALLDESLRELRFFGVDGTALGDTPAWKIELPAARLLPEHQDWLLGRGKTKPILKRDNFDAPSVILPVSQLKTLKEFLFIPLRKSQPPPDGGQSIFGFVWVGCSREEGLSRPAVKNYLRMSCPLTLSLWAANLLKRARQQTALISIRRSDAPAEEQESSLEALVDRYLQLFIDMTGVERASLMLLDPKNRKLKIFAAKGQRVYPFSGASIPKGSGIAGQSLANRESIWVTHWGNQAGRTISHRLKRWTGGRREEPLKSLACVPLAVDGRALGVLNLSTIDQVKQFEITEMEGVREAADRFSKILQDRLQPAFTLRHG